MVDRGTFKAAEKVLQYLKENDMLMTRGAILVGNKTDLQRHREVSRQGECVARVELQLEIEIGLYLYLHLCVSHD